MECVLADDLRSADRIEVLDGGKGRRVSWRMRPVDIQQIGEELAIKWEDGSESFIGLEKLRRCCPCAGCKGEMDVMGNVYKNPESPLAPTAFQLVRVDTVGGYAVQPVWADGHATGLYSFEYLKRVGESPG